MTTVRTPPGDLRTDEPTRSDDDEGQTNAYPSTQLDRDPRCTIHLEDGTAISGTSFGAEKNIAGELVFFTGQTRARTPGQREGNTKG